MGVEGSRNIAFYNNTTLIQQIRPAKKLGYNPLARWNFWVPGEML